MKLSRSEELIFIKIPSILIALIPILLVTGPFLPDLVVSILTLIFFYFLFKKKFFYFFKLKVFIFFLIFWIYIVINSFINGFDNDSLRISISYIRFGIFSLYFLLCLENNKNILKNIFFVCLFIYLILLIDGSIQFLFGKNLFGYELKDNFRVSSFFNDELIYGSFLARFMPLILALYSLKSYSKKLGIFIFCIFVLSEVMIFLSGERASFFFLNLSSITIILLTKNLKKIRILSVVISFFVIILISIFNPSYKERIVDRTINQIGFQNKEQKKYIFSQQHTDHYLSAIKMFHKNIFFGVGIKSFSKECKDKEYYISNLSCSTHPHNTYIQLLSETGIFGFCFVFFVFFLLLYSLLKHFYLLVSKKFYYFNDFEICIFSCILISLWPLAPTGNFFNNWLSIVYFYPIPLLIWSLKNRGKISI